VVILLVEWKGDCTSDAKVTFGSLPVGTFRSDCVSNIEGFQYKFQT
jgi:hypothetical protein